MDFVSIGDLMGATRRQTTSAALRQRLDQLGIELATGKKADITATTSGDTRELSSITRTLGLLGAYRSAASETMALAETYQLSLSRLQDTAQSAGEQFLLAANTGDGDTFRRASKQAVQSLETAINTLNTRHAGRSIFAGQETGTQTLNSPQVLLDALEVAISGLTTVSDVSSAVEDFFNNPAGVFSTSIYQGSDQPLAAQSVGQHDTVNVGMLANDDAFRAELRGLSTVALISRGLFADDLGAQAALLTQAGEHLLGAASGIVDLRADIGISEEKLSSLQASNAAQENALQLRWSELTSTDPYETASAFQAIEGQLEALYMTTSRIANLSLTRYLR